MAVIGTLRLALRTLLVPNGCKPECVARFVLMAILKSSVPTGLIPHPNLRFVLYFVLGPILYIALLYNCPQVRTSVLLDIHVGFVGCGGLVGTPAFEYALSLA